ncbi:MAG TPA: MFS transporter [Candidatus Acidoferrales bacterium]|nr:MFS transporter [Candidatus Acidoferrales bacterium]
MEFEASYNERVSESQTVEKHEARHSAHRGDDGRVIRTDAMFRALRHRNFQLFFSGQLISLIGTWMQNLAQSWLVYRLTGSALLLGVVGFSGQIPVFIFAPLGGMIADRRSRHRVVIATQTISMILAFILAGLTLAHKITVPEIIILAVLLGIVNAFDIPARQAFLGDMVHRDDLMNAIALNSSMFNGARVVGPAVAGVLVAWIGEGWCFFANAISYIAVIVGLLLMTIAKHHHTPTSSPYEHIAEGFRFVRRTKPIRALLLLLGCISLLALPYSVLMPIFADRILHGGARGYGILMGCAGLGALGGALTLAMRTGMRGLGRWIAIACASFGTALIAFSFSRTFWLSAVLLVPAGYAVMLQTSASNTLLQAMSPNSLRGRVLAVYSMMFMGMAPIGALLAGDVAKHIGAPLTVCFGGIGAIIGAAFFARILPQFRMEARELLIASGMAAGQPPESLPARPAS